MIVATGVLAVPLNGTALGLPAAECVIDSDADLLPEEAGEKLTRIVHTPRHATAEVEPLQARARGVGR
ncbi:MAG: hypothetical protein U5L03_05345 [Burkholderiaceae bacterium]|nr:hypothetical protein [Burkholderiaceae bacterium]